jgi:LmbE family N-acetylglucosaminyl deacetylase
MKNISLFLFSVLFIFITACNEKPSIEELKKFAAIENYPNDAFLDTVSNKKALVIVAHDDDDCAMSGTIAKLTANGWEIKQLSLQSHILPKTGKNPAPIICQGNELILEDGYYRKGLDTMKVPYLPIPYSEISEQFLTDKVALAVIDRVNEFNPSVIFTLDNIKGGYGHPEHIFISQLVLNLYEAKKINTEKIYQSVYTNHMEAEIVDKWLKAKMEKWGYPHASTIANNLYKIDGMPEPTVQINIVDFADKKKQYLMEYDESVRKNLRKFIPYYEDFDAKTYFGIFDREFFRVIEK